MSTQRSARLSELFHRALARDPLTRDTFLNEACQGDDVLRRELERLLAAHAEAGSFLQEPIGALTPLPNAQLAPGTPLGAYTVTAFIGAGGMGEVYRATDTRLGRDVALKVLPGDLSADAQRRQRFEREARAIAALNHPNICTIHDVGQADGIDYLVMELLEGETLATRLARGSLPQPEVLSIATQMGDALAAAHRAGIIHRDLKPGNIMLSRAGASSAGSQQAKLLDFGLARPVVREETIETTQAALTRRGDLLGTLPYMAPEQLDGRQVDARSDIWAFGCVLYEMVSGHGPFTASSDARLISAILTTEPPALTSSPLDRLIRKCLAKDPDRRWQTAADLTDELRWISGWSGEAASPAPVADAARRRARWWRWFMLAAAGLALAAAGIAAGYFLRPSPEVGRTHFDFPPPPGTVWGDGLAISPDGRRVAFVANSGDKSSIWIHDLADMRTRQLDDTEGAEIQLFWSPDSVSLGFFAGGKLKTVPADGGSVMTLADASVPGGGTWNRDGVIVFSPDSTRGLRRVRADRTAEAELTTLSTGPERAAHRYPVFLPNGRDLLYVTRDGVFATSLDDPGRQARRVLDEPSTVQVVLGHLLFVRQRSLFARPFDSNAMEVFGEETRIVDGVDEVGPRSFGDEFSVSETGALVYRSHGVSPVRRFIWKNRRGDEVSRLPMTGALDAPALSPDGKRLAYSENTLGNSDIFVLDLDRPVPQRRTFDSGSDRYPAWSPDGNLIAFARDEGRAGLFQVDRQGLERRLLQRGADTSAMYAHGYTRDGRTLLVGRFGRGLAGGLYTLSLEGVHSLVEFFDSPARELVMRLSPDNDWLAYLSNESGRYEVYVQRYPSGGGKTQVSNGMQSNANMQWSADGTELFYVGLDNRLMAAPMKGGTRTGLPVPLFRLGAAMGFAVAKDGLSFLINAPATGSDAKTTEVLVNWPARLKR